jgi:hypothetical protein
MTQRHKKYIIAILIALATAFFRFNSLNFTNIEIEGDEFGYSYHAVYTLAAGLNLCRSLFGEAGTCGIRPPSQHGVLTGAFDQTEMDRYLAGEIGFDTVAGMPGYPIKTPLETLFSRWNATSLTLGFSLWGFGGDYAGFLLLQNILLALASMLAFEIGCRLSNLVGGILAGAGWAIHSLIILSDQILPQPLTSVLFLLGMLALVYGMRYKSGPWLLLGCAANGLAGWYAVGHRPAMAFLVPLLLIGFYLVQRSERRLALWPAVWLAVLCLFVLVTFFLRKQLTVGSQGQYLTFSQHVSHALAGGQSTDTPFNPFSLFDREGWKTEVYPRVPPPETPLEMIKALSEDPSLSARVLPVMIFRIWSAPWALVELPVPVHQAVVVIGFAGLFLSMGYRDWRGALAWIYFAAISVSTFGYAYLSVEPRYVVPFLGPLWALGGALLGNLLCQRHSSRRTIIGLGIAVAVLILVSFWGLSVLSIQLYFLPSRILFGIVLATQMVLMVGIFFGGARQLKPSPWRWQFSAVPVVVTLFIVGMGLYAGHWRQWELRLVPGVVARQFITLPKQIAWHKRQIPWLMFDTFPGDNLEVRINGQMVKDAGQSLVEWQAEDDVYSRIWRGLKLDHSYLQPNGTLEVEVRAAGEAPVTLIGDIPPDDPAVFVGPAIDYIGEYRSVWRERWSPIDDPRVTRPFDLKGVTYTSEITLEGGQIKKDDLSPIFGRQHGLYRIFLGVFDPGESPPVDVDKATLAALSKHIISPEKDLVLTEGGVPKLRFVGHNLERLPQENMFRLKLYFEVLEAPEQDYFLWLYGHVRDTSILPEDRQEIGYAYLDRHEPPLPLTRWQSGKLYGESLDFRTNPGDYELSFGFSGIGEDKSRLYLDQSNAYAVTLGWYRTFEDKAPVRVEDLVWFDWVDQNLPAGSRVMATYIPAVLLTSDKVFIQLDPQGNIVEQVVDQKADYIIYDLSSLIDQQYLAPLLDTFSEDVSIIYRGGGWRVYKVNY